MKRILSLAMALSLAASQAFSYTVDTLRRVESLTAATATAEAAFRAVSPNAESRGMALIGDLSKEANNLMAYAIQDQTFMVRVARVLDRVASKAAWQKTERLNAEFLKSFGVELAHGISSEAVSYFKGKALAAALPSVSDSRIVARAANALATALTVSLVDTGFAHLERALELPGAVATADATCTDLLVGTFLTTLITEAAYNLAGEMILRGATDARVEVLSDLFPAAK